MRETTNTSKFSLIEEGTFLFTVDGCPEKRRVEGKNSTFRIWKLKYVSLSQQKDMIASILFFPNSPGYHEILLACGGEETSPNNIDWEDESVHGKQFFAKVTHDINPKTGRPQEVFSEVKPLAEEWA